MSGRDQYLINWGGTKFTVPTHDPIATNTKGLISMWTFQDVSVSSETIVTGKGSN